MKSTILTKNAFSNKLDLLSKLIKKGHSINLDAYVLGGIGTDSGVGEIKISLEDVINADAYISVYITKEEAIFLAKSILLHCEKIK